MDSERSVFGDATKVDLRFLREDGQPFKILARGDCTSRRSVHLNADLFPAGFTFIQNQKSPAILFLDAHRGVSAHVDTLHEICDVSSMPKTLAAYYLGQADRSILMESDADLIMIDSYADMNFELWERVNGGEKIWIHPKHLRNAGEFNIAYKKLGRRTLEQSVQDITSLVAILRERNPRAPVLFLNQQIDYYPKLSGRIDYYELGNILSAKIPNSYFGGVVAKEDLLLADIGSCGPGNTLHFQSKTYRDMLEKAFSGNESVVIRKRECGSLETVALSRPFAVDNPNREVYPEIAVSLGFSSSFCTAGCGGLEKDKILENLRSYIYMEGISDSLRWTPAVIEVGDYRDYRRWMTSVNKKYNRRYLMNRSVAKGYFVEEFHPKLFVPDMHDIHHSAAERSGGAMRGKYLSSIEKMGGAPTKMMIVARPKCNIHWSRSFGVFSPEPGHAQGDVVVNKRLLAYISVRRIGDIALYSQVMGHEEYLDDGVMYHLHFKIVEWLADEENFLASGVKLLMYGGVGNGGKSLWQWKNKVGFHPAFLRTN